MFKGRGGKQPGAVVTIYTALQINAAEVFIQHWHTLVHMPQPQWPRTGTVMSHAYLQKSCVQLFATLH